MTYLSLSFAVCVLSNNESALMPQCQINRHEVLQAEVREKDSQMPQTDLLITHQMIFLYQLLISIFQA